MSRNIVVITLDSVRADHTSMGGYDKETTPFIEEISKVNFNDAKSNAPCTPHSMPSMLTGKLPLSEGVLALDKKPTIPYYLNQAGYTTCLVNSNLQIPRFNYHSDFETHLDFSRSDNGSSYNSSTSDIIMNRGKQILNSGGNLSKLGVVLKDTYHRFSGIIQPHVSDKVLVERASQWLCKADEPYFMWVHFMDTHYPYEFEEKYFNQISEFEFDKNKYARLLTRAMTHVREGDFVWELSKKQRQYISDAYDASLRQADANIQLLTESIDLDNTLLVCTSDHGEELWDNGHFGHAGRSSIPRDMTLDREMLHVPLVFGGDVQSSRKQESESQASLIDLMPTILNEAEVCSDDLSFRGKDILNAQLDGKCRHQISHTTSPGDPIDFNNYSDSKWIGELSEGSISLVVDSDENVTVYDYSTGSKVEMNEFDDSEFDEKSNLLRNSISATQGSRKISVDKETQSRLKELGYLG